MRNDFKNKMKRYKNKMANDKELNKKRYSGWMGKFMQNYLGIGIQNNVGVIIQNKMAMGVENKMGIYVW